MTLIPYHANLKYSMRPNNFRLAPDHVLNAGCQFFGGGALAGSSHYHDSSVLGNDGTLTDLEWVLNRGVRGLDFTASTSVATITVPEALSKWTISFWMYPRSGGVGTSYGRVFSDTARANYMFFEGYPSVDLTIGGVVALNGTDIGIADDAWSHVAMTANIDAAIAERLFVYVNGEYVTNSGVYNPLGAGTYCIGNWGTVGDRAFDGFQDSWTLHDRRLSLPEIQLQASGDPMLGGWIQPINTTTYSFPISTGPPPTRKSNIFKSRIIRGIAC